MAKLLLIADMHGENPSGLVREEIKNSGIERVIFLGDYDTPAVLRELRKLRIPKKFLVGNHDYHFVNEMGISGQFMNGLSASDYFELWNDSPREKKFIEKEIQRNPLLCLEEELPFGKVAYAHASLVDAGSPDSDAPGYVWGRMNDINQVLLNFAKMKEKNYSIFFRAHDHDLQGVLTFNPKAENCFEYLAGDRIRLQKSRRHIVNVGAFVGGSYTVFDDKSGDVHFWNTIYGPRLKK